MSASDHGSEETPPVEEPELQDEALALRAEFLALYSDEDMRRLLQARTPDHARLGLGQVPRTTTIDKVELRQSQFSKLYEHMLSKSRLVPFKSTDDPIPWLENFNDYICRTAKNLCKINLVTQPLTDTEFVELLHIKLEYSVRTELDQKFDTLVPKLTWDKVKKTQITELLIAQFGTKEPEMSCLLNAFGPDRFKKAKDMAVKNFHPKWKEQLPKCLVPKTEEERVKLADLVLRTSSYHSLDDPYLQEECSKIPEDEQSIDKFYQAAIKW